MARGSVSRPGNAPSIDNPSLDDVMAMKASTSTKPLSQTSQNSQRSTSSRWRTPRSTKTAAPTSRVSRSQARLLSTVVEEGSGPSQDFQRPDFVLKIMSDVGASQTMLDMLASDPTLVSLCNLLLNQDITPRRVLRLLSHDAYCEAARHLHSMGSKTFDGGLQEYVDRANEGHEDARYWQDPFTPEHQGDVDDLEDNLPDTQKSVEDTKQEMDFEDADAFPTPVKKKHGASPAHKWDEGKQDETHEWQAPEVASLAVTGHEAGGDAMSSAVVRSQDIGPLAGVAVTNETVLSPSVLPPFVLSSTVLPPSVPLLSKMLQHVAHADSKSSAAVPSQDPEAISTVSLPNETVRSPLVLPSSLLPLSDMSQTEAHADSQASAPVRSQQTGALASVPAPALPPPALPFSALPPSALPPPALPPPALLPSATLQPAEALVGVSLTNNTLLPLSETPQSQSDSTSPNAISPETQMMAMEEAPTVGEQEQPPQDAVGRQDNSQELHATTAPHHISSEHIDSQGRRVGEDADNKHLDAHGGQREDNGSHLAYLGEDRDNLDEGVETMEEPEEGDKNVEQDGSEDEGPGPLSELPELYEHDADRSRNENLRGMKVCMWNYMDYMAQRCRVSLDTAVDRVFATRMSNGRSSNAWNTYLAMHREDPVERARLTAMGIPLKGERLSFSWAKESLRNDRSRC